jgi:hypothetical protein
MRLFFSLCSWKQNHIEYSFICLYQNTGFGHNIFLIALELLLFQHLGFILNIFLWLFVFSLSLSLGCVTHLSDKMITWIIRQEIYLSWISWESSLKWEGNNEVFIPLNYCLDFYLGLMNLVRSVGFWLRPFLTGGPFFILLCLSSFSFIIYYYFSILHA